MYPGAPSTASIGRRDLLRCRAARAAAPGGSAGCRRRAPRPGRTPGRWRRPRWRTARSTRPPRGRCRSRRGAGRRRTRAWSGSCRSRGTAARPRGLKRVLTVPRASQATSTSRSAPTPRRRCACGRSRAAGACRTVARRGAGRRTRGRCARRGPRTRRAPRHRARSRRAGRSGCPSPCGSSSASRAPVDVPKRTASRKRWAATEPTGACPPRSRRGGRTPAGSAIVSPLSTRARWTSAACGPNAAAPGPGRRTRRRCACRCRSRHPRSTSPARRRRRWRAAAAGRRTGGRRRDPAARTSGGAGGGGGERRDRGAEGDRAEAHAGQTPPGREGCGAPPLAVTRRVAR